MKTGVSRSVIRSFRAAISKFFDIISDSHQDLDANGLLSHRAILHP